MNKMKELFRVEKVEEYKEHIKKSIKRLEQKIRVTNDVENWWNENPMDEEREQAYDRAYEREYLEFEHLTYLIVKVSGIEFKQAREIVRTKLEDVKMLFA